MDLRPVSDVAPAKELARCESTDCDNKRGLSNLFRQGKGVWTVKFFGTMNCDAVRWTPEHVAKESDIRGVCTKMCMEMADTLLGQPPTEPA